MKIGIVCYPTFGGSGVVATELGMALAREGHEVHFISYSQPFRLDIPNENVFFHEVPVSNYPLFEFLPYEISLTSKLVDVCMRQQLDLMHVHYAIPHASAAYLARQILSTKHRRVPFVTTLHGTDITLVGRDPSYQSVIEFAINQSDAVTTVSEDLRKDTLRYFSISRNIDVVPNFIEPDNYTTAGACKRSDYAQEHEKLLIHISNFRPVKRLPDVLAVFNRIQSEIPAKMLFVGDGPDRQLAEDLADTLGIKEQVIFLGTVKNIEQITGICDLFILASETESFGLSALEAMASGVPVISTNTGGIPEVNKHGYSGFLCNVGDTEEMAAYALQLLRNPGLLEQFRKQAKAEASRFDLKYILPMYEAIYQRVIGL